MPAMFAIERRAMDRAGKVIAFLDDYLPSGRVLDIGAGNGFTAQRLNTAQRQIIPIEPNASMIDRAKSLVWVRGLAQAVPLRDNSMNAAYATWAFFFAGIDDLDIGLAELERVVHKGGKIAIIDNAGNDEFCSYAKHSIAADFAWWHERGFTSTIINTAFEFESLDEAHTMMRFYFGDDVISNITSTSIEYKVVAFCKMVK